MKFCPPKKIYFKNGIFFLNKENFHKIFIKKIQVEIWWLIAKK
jgi:hypothetical protein